MGRFIKDALFFACLTAQFLILGCVSVPTIEKPAYRPLLRGQPLSNDTINSIKKSSPKDAVFVDLLQAFALMRTGPIEEKTTQNEILGLLTESVNSFQDLTDPVNFSKAFTADEDKPFKGRPHERMFASTMTAVFYMAQNRCDMALPYLREAEFLDARFQKMPFGTDAPLIYALMYRCLKEGNRDIALVKHASDGVFRSVRFLSMQEPLINALIAISDTDMRAMAVSNRLAYLLYEVSLYYTLMTAPNDFDSDQIIDDAAKNAEIFISSITSNFENEYKESIKPALSELANLYGLKGKEGFKHLQDLAFQEVPFSVKQIASNMKKVTKEISKYRKSIREAKDMTLRLSDEILRAASGKKLALNFTGMGPTLRRQGSYEEISVVVKSPDANPKPEIRERNIKTNMACGFHRTADEDFSVVLCEKGASLEHRVELLPSLELLSLSRKATTTQGRQFEKVLKGRAQFRAATENIATVTAWSAFFLFHMGASIMNECQRQNAGEACYTRGLAVMGIAALTGVFSGTIWLIGRTTNPAADSRFIHLMYESGWLGLRNS